MTDLFDELGVPRDDPNPRRNDDTPMRRPRNRRRRSRPTFFGVLGEVLITGGVVVLLFLGWQLWWNDWIMSNQQASAAQDLTQQFIENDRATQDPTAPPPDPAVGYGDPVVGAAPTDGEAFAVLYIPRYDINKPRKIAEGTGTNVLNSEYLGIGHYPGTQMPGEVGNFAVAAHRSAYGGGMHLINEFQLGDPIYVQTQDGWYTYRFRDLEYVQDTQVDVLNPVPGVDGIAPTDRIITLTSCNPLYSTAERIIAYGVFESWQPTSAGPPADIAAAVNADVQAQG
ncbi:class E sortase [Compostimonas suwonensis]|uniref:Sortase A n=1 Tax=Compostimonas suwonensis TaxID=1048394 RepID=A0A2M9C442_9MICO|nr:class E sortase [Compostimonas suwonensis]PJJ65282.1 sortase A [Compostimonas suwonensis]